MTISASRSASAAAHASRWPERKLAKPKRSLRAAARSIAATLAATAAVDGPYAKPFTQLARSSRSTGESRLRADDGELLERELPVRARAALERILAREAGVAVGV